MSGWGCPHEAKGMCQKVPGHVCDPGMKGCVLFGRFTFSDPTKNRPAEGWSRRGPNGERLPEKPRRR